MNEMLVCPTCQDGRHFDCSRWWWRIKDQIALYCHCWCRSYPMATLGSSGPR
jgi:hypothetical protein